ncbi:MAG: hypothetical protein RDU20_15120 [Desulfomonilaceae bacterium]|nr:hypothetical protein [Desulfomonilaceae bacterium]
MAINNDKGSAVAIVLMFLGVLSLVGAGLMLQTKLDVMFTRATESSTSMIGLADGAANKAVMTMPSSPPASIGTDPVVTGTADEQEVQRMGHYQRRQIFVGKAPSGALDGFEISGSGYGGGGYYPAYWLAEGFGWKFAHPDKKKMVQIPILKAHKE